MVDCKGKFKIVVRCEISLTVDSLLLSSTLFFKW